MSKQGYRDHLIKLGSTIRTALVQLDKLAKDAILFVVDNEDRLIGSLTDGDVRRGLIRGIGINDTVDSIIQAHPKFIKKSNYNLQDVISHREGNYRILPIVDNDNRILNILNFRNMRSYLPVDAVIMAGGRGQRLSPLTDTIPKPLLKIGNKPIIEYNLERLALYGVDDFWISINYLGEKIEDYLGNGSNRDVKIEYVWEDKPLGTIGAVSKISDLQHDYVLITNSDVLTNLDYEHFFLDFIEKDADISVVSIPYNVNIPYAVLETQGHNIINFKEKPTITYYSNGGIYLFKKSILEYIPKNAFFNATDLLEQAIKLSHKVISYPLAGYWLDIGKHDDYAKAQMDIGKIKF